MSDLDKHFDSWFDELEGFAFRSERAMEAFGVRNHDEFYLMQRWLKAAFRAGMQAAYREQMEHALKKLGEDARLVD